MKEDFEKIVEEGIATKNVNNFGRYSQELCKKYGISERTLYSRFTSVFGKSPKNVIAEKVFPSKDELIALVLDCESSEEVRLSLGLSNRYFVGLYDKYFGVSTFQKARVKILAERLPTPYVPNIDDNISILYSQVLGDGSYDSKRHSIRIQHGIKQVEYLKWKVSLINKAYPKTPSVVSIRTHSQGHEYADWYSTKMGNVDLEVPLTDMVRKLTPLGWFLWYLDDGSLCQNVTICIPNESVANAAKLELTTYGIVSRYDQSGIKLIMCGQENDVKFYKIFCEPFLSIMPRCMKYKVEDIVGRLRI